MYYSIKGKIIICQEGRLVVECGGIGYDIGVSNNTLSKIGRVGDDVLVYTYLQVAENDMRLFGFYSLQEKSLFESLLQVSGIGPKGAMQVLSSQTVDNLLLCIANGDVATLSRAKGIGKKTAERIVLELKGKLEMPTSGEGVNLSDIMTSDNAVVFADSVTQDAIMALISLGISKADATNAVAKARKTTDKLENIITIALRSMA